MLSGVSVINKNSRGSMTVEAAVIMPIFIISIYVFIYVMKIFSTYTAVHTAVMQTARQFSYYSYIYKVIGGPNAYDKMNNKFIASRSEIEKQINIFSKMYKNANKLVVSGSFNDFFNITNDNLRIVKEFADNPQKEIQLILDFVSGSIFNKSKTAAILPVLENTVKKHLAYGDKNPDKHLNSLDIKEGKFDFSKSTFLDDGKSIKIVLEYRISPKIPIKIIPDLKMRHCIVVNAWLNGVEVQKEKIKNTNLWEISPAIKRGLAIESAELNKTKYQLFIKTSKYFSGIDAYRIIPGVKVDIELYNFFSINPFSESYAKGYYLKKRIMSEVKKLADFRNYNDLDTNINIKNYRKVYKKALLILPENPLTDSFLKVYEKCCKESRKKGVDLEYIQDYGEVERAKSTSKNQY